MPADHPIAPDTRLRRRRVQILRAADELAIDAQALLSGGLSMQQAPRLSLLCPVRGRSLPLETSELALVMAVPADRWAAPTELAPTAALQAQLLDLARRGILLSDPPLPEAADIVEGETQLAGTHWNDLAAVYHAHTGWQGVNAVAAGETVSGPATTARIAAVPAFYRRDDLQQRLPLTLPELEGPFFDVLRERRTTRAFRVAEPLPRPALESMLYAVFGAHGLKQQHGMAAIKRTSPSGGALHPIEAYMLATHVDGVPCGLYHYETGSHALALLEALQPAQARELALQFTAGQGYFADAHALVVHVARFDRSFAKYAHHRKAYKAVLMDSAHLSQTLYLAATHLGLGAYYTAAINDLDIARRLRLPPLRHAAVAINGIGLPAAADDGLHFVPDPYRPTAPGDDS